MTNPVVRLLAPLLAVLAIAVLLLIQLRSNHASLRTITAPPALSADIVIPANSMPAPELGIRDQHSQPVSMSGLRGRVVAITFLDSHCRRCAGRRGADGEGPGFRESGRVEIGTNR